MKKIKIILILLGLVILTLKTDVLAYSLKCDYDIMSNDNTLKLGTVRIEYDKDTDSAPILTKENLNKGIYYFLGLSSGIPLSALQKSSNNSDLNCPTLYLKDETLLNSTFTIYYMKSECGADYCRIIEPVNSIIDNDNKPSNSNNNYISCSCKNTKENYKYFYFDIEKENDQLNFKNVVQKGISEYENDFKFEFFNFSYSCPTYVKVEQKHLYNVAEYNITASENETDYMCSANNDYQENNEFLARYVLLRHSESIYIKKSSSYQAYDNNNNKIEILNIDSFNNQVYLVKKDNTYQLVDEINDNDNYTSIYMLSSQINKLNNIGKAEIEKTCEAIFGGGEGSFMGFLKNNVFTVIWIAVPIILLVLTTIDFAKVVFNDDKEGLNNAWKRFGKRAIAAVLIYLTPTILIFIADVIGADDVNSCIKAIQNMNEGS